MCAINLFIRNNIKQTVGIKIKYLTCLALIHNTFYLIMKKIYATLVIAMLCHISYAQSLADIQNPKILPPSPEASALGRYGQIPVSKNPGTPNIDIPIYEIKTPRFTLPISISYLATGIKVDETATW